MHSRHARFLCRGESSNQSTNQIARKPPFQFATSGEIRVSQSLKFTKSKEEEEVTEDEKIAASALLELASLQDPWTIKKKLTKTDVGQNCRLLICTKSVQEEILPNLSAPMKREVESDEGLLVGVRDCDTGNVIKLRFKWLHSNKSFVFNEGWRPEFVHRRGLKPDDVIGLFWNKIDGLFAFSVLNRADC